MIDARVFRIEMVATGKLKGEDVISHVLALADIDRAHEIAIDTKSSMKVVIDPWAASA